MQLLEIVRDLYVKLPLLGFEMGLGRSRVGFGFNTQTHNLSIMGKWVMRYRVGFISKTQPNKVIGFGFTPEPNKTTAAAAAFDAARRARSAELAGGKEDPPAADLVAGGGQ